MRRVLGTNFIEGLVHFIHDMEQLGKPYKDAVIWLDISRVRGF